MDPALVLGPVGALALALIMLALFYTGRILPRNTVPREELDAVRALNAAYAEKFSQLTEAVKDLGEVLDRMNHR